MIKSVICLTYKDIANEVLLKNSNSLQYIHNTDPSIELRPNS